MSDLYYKQIELENEMHGAGILRFTKNNQRSIDSGTASETDWLRRLTREFVKPMADAITAYKDYYAKRKGNPSATLAHLKCISPEASAYIAIKTIFDSLSASISAQHLSKTIGMRIEDEIRFTKLSEASPEYIGAIKASLKKRASKSYQFEHDALVHAEKEIKLLDNFQKLHSGDVDKQEILRLLEIDEDKYDKLLAKVDYAVDFDRWVPWSQNDVLQLGSKMIDIFANNMVINDQPLIKRVSIDTSKAGKKNTPVAIVATDELDKWVTEYQQVMGGLSPAYEPCVIPPRPWKSPFNGGYHTPKVSDRLNLVKCPNKKHLKRLSVSQMPNVYKAVNALQEVKWCINDRILAVANEVRRKSLPLAMPDLNKQEPPVCPIPSIYSDLRGKELLAVLDDTQKEDFMRWKRETVAYYQAEQKRRGDVREAIATIDQGMKFKEFDSLHYVYTLDFRGRVYAQASLISPQGGDLQKAMIKFAETCPLGASGEYWFKVHGANVWGEDKLEFNDRVSYTETEEFIDMCLDIAADPVSFTQWTGADKPWQFLAWCFEYADLIEWKEEGEDPELFESAVAVAMDGSCSGIQHYSAMLRDSVGGKEVNLVPSSKPQDIYRAVSDVVTDWMESVVDGYTQDVPMWSDLKEKYGEVKCYKFAQEWLRIQVTRAMTKKPVMTLPYGSSQLTCRDSIESYLNDLQAKSDKKALGAGIALGKIHNFDEDKISELPKAEAVSYASAMTWKGIGEVVVAARAAMKYIKQVTKVIADKGEALEWTTPLGFIVRQEIFEIANDRQVFTNMLGGCKFRVKEFTNKIDPRRMGSSCAPNFVHSMDASHLLSATCGFKDNGLESIAVIHDSFGTHAGKTEVLRKVLLDSFVDMYTNFDVISSFKEENEERLMMEIDVDIPEKGDLDLEVVRDSLYCFG